MQKGEKTPLLFFLYILFSRQMIAANSKLITPACRDQSV
jgi:hypothetical protein